MRIIQLVLLVFGIFGFLAIAQNGNQTVPACAIKCMTALIPISACSLSDHDCLCTNQQLRKDLRTCMLASCSVKECLLSQRLAAKSCNFPVHNKQSLIRHATIGSFAMFSVFFFARIISRLPVLGGELGADDYLAMLAYALGLAYSILLMMLVDTGLGKDVWEIPFEAPNDQVTMNLILYAGLEKAYILTTWITKMSMLCLFLRIFPDPRFRRNVKYCLILFGVTIFCLFWACLLKCWPVSYAWTYWDGEHEGKCSSSNAQGWANAGLNIIGDLIVLILPLPTIWRMSLSMGRKIGIIFMFGIGIFITMISVIRCFSLSAYGYSTNATWEFVDLTIWSTFEVGIGIVCACLPGTVNFYNRVIRGKILNKGPFARRGSQWAAHSSDHADKQRGRQRKRFDRDNISTAMTNFSSATTLDGEHQDGDVESVKKDRKSAKEFILVTSDVDISHRDASCDIVGRPQGQTQSRCKSVCHV